MYDPHTGLPAQAYNPNTGLTAQAYNPNTGLQTHAVAIQISQPVPSAPSLMGVHNEHLPAQQHVPVGGNGYVAEGQMHAQPQVYYNSDNSLNNGRRYPFLGHECPVHPAFPAFIIFGGGLTLIIIMIIVFSASTGP